VHLKVENIPVSVKVALPVAANALNFFQSALSSIELPLLSFKLEILNVIYTREH
jgi:hypothetical protein